MPRRISLLAVRGLLALCVAWGAISEMTSPLFALFHLPVETIQRLYPKTKYTWVTWKYEQRGWPFSFVVRTNVPAGASEIKNEDDPVALACDLVLLGILVFAAWKLLRGWRRQFTLARALEITAALGVTMAFQIRAWDHNFDNAKIAIDIGVFSMVVMISRLMGRLAITFFRGQEPQVSDVGPYVPFLTDEMRQAIARDKSTRVCTDQ
jgi:hypothetical protein